MSELYRAIAGSPITYLAADISANQTTISIADDSVLPDAPNICTIGYGENIETIRYGAKSNGVLQNVTRGLEGTPRAWKAGTEVARFYTAYEHNAIVETIESHLAESAKKHITESGSNEKGRYIKFDDGTMICWGKSSILTLSFPPSPNWGSLFTTGQDSIPKMPFPVPFVGDIPYVKLDFERISAGNFWIMRSNGDPSLTHSGSAELVRGAILATPITGRATYFAIGRWK